jgi:hypothetical protein
MRGRRGAAPFRFRHNRLELLRTRELLQRQLPSPPAVVLDVGGGTGVRAAWLAGRGYRCISSTFRSPKLVPRVTRCVPARLSIALLLRPRLDPSSGSARYLGSSAAASRSPSWPGVRV